MDQNSPDRRILSAEERNARFRKTVEELATKLAQLVAEKNAAYGDSFADTPFILRKLYPDGVRPDQYEDMLGIVRVLDKLKRIATKKDAFGENPWKDVAGYGLVAITTEELRKIESVVPEITRVSAAAIYPPRYEGDDK